MPVRPWMKFYPSDWQSDQVLGMCSLGARGLWMEMLAVMHKAEPYGHLLVNGKKPSDEQLAALARAPVDQIRACAHELEQAGVFSRTRNGTIYSRRMTRDEKRRKDGEQSAKTGKIPGSRRDGQVVENDDGSLPPPGGGMGVVDQPPSPHMPEAREKKEKELLGGKPPDRPGMAFVGKVIRLKQEDFERWRAAYGNLDLLAELTNRDDWLANEATASDRKRWFMSTSNWLNGRNAKADPRAPAKQTRLTPLGVGG